MKPQDETVISFSKILSELFYDKGLDKDRVVDVVCRGIAAAYTNKRPQFDFVVTIDPVNEGAFFVGVKKSVVAEVTDSDKEISFEKAKEFLSKGKEESFVVVPVKESLGRVDILVAKNFIATAIKKMEQESVYLAYKDRVGDLVTGNIYKKESSGVVVNLGDTLAFLPKNLSGSGFEEVSNAPVRAILKSVAEYTTKGYQVVLDRLGVEFLLKLFELEIPEIFEGLVEVVAAERVGGYRSKVLLRSRAKNIDPVGACIGVDGSRIRPIRKEIGNEAVDLIAYDEDKSALLKKVIVPGRVVKINKDSNETADPMTWISRVVIFPVPENSFVVAQDNETSFRELATVFVQPGKKAYFVGKEGFNVKLASRLLKTKIDIVEEGV